ncbi:hypothetical protein V491_02079 [Pseudogymnoascus sp. VKM F-3775]|nr:hypothetical protein V491_02079 [Pseudogymnoascus sp. VKM F-3775]
MSSHLQQRQSESQTLKQACDHCHVRKKRCDSNNPCENCQGTDLQCTYRAPKKRGPKRQQKFKDAFQAAKEQQKGYISQVPCLWGTSEFQASPLLSDEIIQSCLDAFFAYKYPIMPILNRGEVCARLPHLHASPTDYSLITALCAVVTLQTEISPPSSLRASYDAPRIDFVPSADFFISETCRARKYCNYTDNPSLATVQTSFFLFAIFFCLGKDNSAWFYIRESITVLQSLRLHEEATYITMTDPRYATNCRRTFWLLFVTERDYALQRHCSTLILSTTIYLPTVEPGPETPILRGFLELIALFQNFDEAILSLWNSSTDYSTPLESLAKLQDSLQHATPHMSETTEAQKADLLVSRQWLKTIVWQLCVSRGLLSSKSATECMSFHYPVTIAEEIILASQLLPFEAFKANRAGISEKIFDIGCSLADALQVHSNIVQSSAPEIGPGGYLMELVQILGMAGGKNSKYLRLLVARVDECLGAKRGSLFSSSCLHGV